MAVFQEHAPQSFPSISNDFLAEPINAQIHWKSNHPRNLYVSDMIIKIGKGGRDNGKGVRFPFPLFIASRRCDKERKRSPGQELK